MTKDKRGSKTAGQIAYEAAGAWMVKHPGTSSAEALPSWETLDSLAREYWDMIASAVRAPLIADLSAVIGSEARASVSKPIRGLWLER